MLVAGLARCRHGHVRPLRNRQHRDVALGDRLRQEIELLLGELVLLVVDVAVLPEHGHDRLDRVELSVDSGVALELGVVLGLRDLATGQRVLQSCRLQNGLVDREPEVDEEVPAAELLGEDRELLGHVGLEVPAPCAVVDVQVGALGVLGGSRGGGALDGLLDVDVEHRVPAVVVVPLDVGEVPVPLLETDLLVERLEGPAVGVQRERGHSADEQCDVVLDDLDRSTVRAFVERELVGALAGRVVVEVVADSRELLVRRAEAVDVGLAGRDDGVVLVVDSRFTGRRADLRAPGQNRDRNQCDDDACELDVHEISLGWLLIQTWIGSAYSDGTRTAGSSSRSLIRVFASFSACRCAMMCFRISGLMSSNRSKSGAVRARYACIRRLPRYLASTKSPKTINAGSTTNRMPASTRAMANPSLVCRYCASRITNYLLT